MRYSWDRKKSDANYRERGFDFSFASMIFEGPVLIVEDQRRDYGERRFVAIGLADQIHITLVFTDRAGSERRHHSANHLRPAQQLEREKAI